VEDTVAARVDMVVASEVDVVVVVVVDRPATLAVAMDTCLVRTFASLYFCIF
jgi:hypothetical protein